MSEVLDTRGGHLSGQRKGHLDRYGPIAIPTAPPSIDRTSAEVLVLVNGGAKTTMFGPQLMYSFPLESSAQPSIPTVPEFMITPGVAFAVSGNE